MGDCKVAATSPNELLGSGITPERWQQIKDVLAEMLEADPSERAGRLQEVCGNDQALRLEVESLLAAGEKNEATLQAPVIDIEKCQRTTCRLWQKIGPYQIVEEIGVGGMGHVYRAARVDAHYTKEVAIKVVEGGINSEFLFSKFKNERQILASLEHPNIARLLDGGTIDEGAPYLVMELIQGEPIDDYCNHHRLSISERLGLFLQVCTAVQFAHQRLIIHRDIKPGNILVNNDAVPKLLDFGIAKLLDPESDSTNVTMTMFPALTPAYASPEQIRGLPITTSSDVYSLGVVLYEMLTGLSPYRVTRRTPQELAHAVLEMEPERPSSALCRAISTSTSPNPMIPAGAAFREGSPDKLKRRLRGDLDNILAKALRKEPEDRYSSVEQFAQDIERYVLRLPVTASRGTVSYRAAKFIARHKAAVLATSVTVLTLFVGFLVTLREAHIAREQRTLAQQRFNYVRQLTDSLLFDFHDSIRDLPGSTAARKLLVDRALKYLDWLSQGAAEGADLRRELATAYERVGDVQGNPRFANLGDTAGAIDSYRKALRLRLALVNGVRRSPDDLVGLASISAKLGLSLGATNDFRASRDTLEAAHPIAERLRTEQKDNPHAQEAAAEVYSGLAYSLYDMGDLTKSLDNFRQSASIREAIVGGPPAFRESVQTNLAGLYDYMSEIVYIQGDLGEALALQTMARDRMAQLVEAHPQNATFQQFLFQAEYGIGYYLEQQHRPKEALRHYEIALSGYRKLAALDAPEVITARYLAKCYLRTGVAMAAQGRTEESIQYARKGLRILEVLSAADKADTYYKAPDLAYARSALGEVYSSVAAQPNISKAARARYWREARSWYQSSLDEWLLLKKQVPLARWDAGQPERIAHEIANCDAALFALRSE